MVEGVDVESEGRGVRVVDVFFVFQAEDGIRGAQESRGLGDVYKRQEGTGSGCSDGRGKSFDSGTGTGRKFYRD